MVVGSDVPPKEIPVLPEEEKSRMRRVGRELVTIFVMIKVARRGLGQGQLRVAITKTEWLTGYPVRGSAIKIRSWAMMKGLASDKIR